MSRRTVLAASLTAALVLATSALAFARPDTPAVACPEGGGVTLSLMVWDAGTHDGSGATTIRRLRVANECAEYALVWYAADPANGVVSSLLVAPGAKGTLTGPQLDALGWNATNTTWQLWIDVEPGAVAENSYCDFITGDQVVPNPQYEMVPSGSLTSYACTW